MFFLDKGGIYLQSSFQINYILEKERFSIHHKLETLMSSAPSKNKIQIGFLVQIIQKQDQSTGQLTEGLVKRILTSSDFHPHGIKVQLENGKIGRVQNILN